jgi:HPr kinase/phosphorylase
VIGGESGLDHCLFSSEIHRPGLALAGFVELYTYDRLQVLGNTEMLYMARLSEEERETSLNTIYQFDIPCVVITDGNTAFGIMIDIANRRGIPLLTTEFSTTKFTHLFSFYLDDLFAPQTTLHGSLVDVYGIGLLFTGRSGIGKSEIALDLVERGHRLVADDIVVVTRKMHGILVGNSTEILRDHLEIRGIGIIDVRRVFGIRAIRLQKRVEVEVRLVDWSDSFSYERVGLEDVTTSILDVEIPVVTVPIYPGKNITVIAEVIALNYLLRVYGQNPAREFNQKLIEAMRRDAGTTYIEPRKDIE